MTCLEVHVKYTQQNGTSPGDLQIDTRRESSSSEHLIGPYLRTWDGESLPGTNMPFKEQAEPLPAPGVPLCECEQSTPSSRTSQEVPRSSF